MTLIAAGLNPDQTVTIVGDRYAGGFDYKVLDHPKIFHLTAGTQPFAIGFAGSPRVAQLALGIDIPPWDLAEHSRHWWLTEFCNRISNRVTSAHQLVDNPERGGVLAGWSEALLAVDGHVVHIGDDLSWEIPARGWHAIGGAHETFLGAAASKIENFPGWTFESTARTVWPIVQQFHHVGPIADTITV